MFIPCLEQRSIYNGPLNPGATYQFLQRGLDSGRKVVETGDWTKPQTLPEKSPIEPPENSNIGVIVGVIVAVILVMVIVSAVFFYLRRRSNNSGKLDGKQILLRYNCFSAPRDSTCPSFFTV